MSETTKTLMLDFQATKSHQSFTKLYKKLSPSLKNYIRGIVKDSDVTEDLLANTFSKIYTKIDQYDPQWQASTWSYTIAHRECLRWIKKERNPRVSLSYFNENGSDVISDDDTNVMSNSNTSKIEVENHKTESQFLEEDEALTSQFDYAIESIQNLKPMYREILTDNLINGMKYREIADKYELPLQTIKNRIRRAKQLVAESLTEEFGHIDI
jgi:RNA polymerase sigma-70 factor (ECF subfamily)